MNSNNDGLLRRFLERFSLTGRLMSGRRPNRPRPKSFADSIRLMQAEHEFWARYGKNIITVRVTAIARAHDCTSKTILRKVDGKKLPGVERSVRGKLRVDLDRLDPLVRQRLIADC